MLPEISEFNVVCHTGGCENKDITILINAVKDNPVVICGPCDTIIEDVTEVG
jgi:hypothetical protein